MSDRSGLSTYTSARMNTVPSSAKPVVAAAQPIVERTRLSGGKRDIDTAAATDNVNPVPTTASASAAQVTEVPAKKAAKITYQLPRQNMDEGHFYVTLGEDIDVSSKRFKILSLLGEGTFGKVVEAWDRKRKEYCAVKIVRKVPKYTRDALVEIQYMERVRTADPDDKMATMKILRHFKNDPGHVCIVMPKCGPCLLDHMQRNGPFPHRHLAEIIFQAGVALDVLHTDMRLMHTDLKPENILLQSGKLAPDAISGRQIPVLPCKIRICDFGGTSDERHSRSAIVSTRHYRAPEVILGFGWMFSCDMWSMGTIIYELYTGKLLYDTHDNLEHLHMMEKSLGKLPADFATRASADTAALFSASNGGAVRAVSDAKSLSRIHRMRSLDELVHDLDLRDLIKGLLSYSRTSRTTARAMCQHPYVLKHYPESRQHPTHPAMRGNLPPTPAQ
jgi:serine/threonine protein kinase